MFKSVDLGIVNRQWESERQHRDRNISKVLQLVVKIV